eukprot:15465364-Alexandrium_andersonii.AAC.1
MDDGRTQAYVHTVATDARTQTTYACIHVRAGNQGTARRAQVHVHSRTHPHAHAHVHAQVQVRVGKVV